MAREISNNILKSPAAGIRRRLPLGIRGSLGRVEQQAQRSSKLICFAVPSPGKLGMNLSAPSAPRSVAAPWSWIDNRRSVGRLLRLGWVISGLTLLSTVGRSGEVDYERDIVPLLQ